MPPKDNKRPPKYLSGDQGQGTTKIRVPFNVPVLAHWISQQPPLRSLLLQESNHNVDDIVDPARLEQSMEVRQFGFGQSNPTFLLQIRNGRTKKVFDKWVLRKKPDQVAHATAHALHREYRVLQALALHNRLHPDQQVPVPRVHVYCQDRNVLGAEFYIMEYIEGRIFTDPSMPSMSNADRSKAYENVIQVLSNLHSVKYKEIGLQDYGRPNRYVERQLERLLAVSQKQSELANEKQNIPEIEQIALQLKQHATKCPNHASLLHGDFKIDNLIFSKDTPDIIGVLDWELSTIGDNYCDLANLSMMYFMPREAPAITGIAGMDLPSLAIPSREQLIEMYCRSSSLESYYPIQEAKQWSGFYLAFLYFKNCVIVQGVAQRSNNGVASSAMAKQVAALLPNIIALTQKILEDLPPPQNSHSRL